MAAKASMRGRKRISAACTRATVPPTTNAWGTRTLILPGPRSATDAAANHVGAGSPTAADPAGSVAPRRRAHHERAPTWAAAVDDRSAHPARPATTSQVAVATRASRGTSGRADNA